MTVWKSGDRAAYRYLFYIDGEPYRGNTKQITKADAEEFEENEKRRVRRQLQGMSVLAEHSPRITDFAAVYLKHLKQRGKVRRPEHVEDLLRVALRFWGAKPSGRNPKNPPVPGEPYHNLRLVDPIRDPDWIEKYDQWLQQRKVRVATDGDKDPVYRPLGRQMRLHYMSIMSRMYRVARLPKFRKKTGVTVNPFDGIERDRPPSRKVTVTPAELRRWLAHTPRHAQVAIAIAALAPKLRKENVLELHWQRSFDPAFQFITVQDHKTVGVTGQPMVVATSRSLRRFLKTLQEGATSPWVVTYRGKPVKEIRAAIRTGAIAAGLKYGRDVGGVTFHTIRHMAATLLAEVPHLTEARRADAMGQDVETTQIYTHLRPVAQRPVMNTLADKLKLDTFLDEAFGRPERKPEVPKRKGTQKPGQPRAKSKRRQIGRRSRSRQ